MDVEIINQIIYNNLEFFFSEEDLNSIFKKELISYEMFLNMIHDLDNPKEKEKENEETKNEDKPNVFNIMHDPTFLNIKVMIGNIEQQLNVIPDIEEAIQDGTVDSLFNDIEKKYSELKYYNEIYVYSHYIFNTIRDNNSILSEINKKITGGGISLEDFKEIIRNHIKSMNL